MPDHTEAQQATDDPRAFATFLLEHAKGRTHDELSHKLRELVAAVADTNKPGNLTLKISVKPTKQEGALEVSDDVKLTAPQGRPSSIFFATDSYDLVRTDPRQLTFDNITEH